MGHYWQGTATAYTDIENMYYYDLNPIIKNKLKQYFEVQTDEELRSYLHLQDPYNINNIPLPEYNDPWITSEGIVFHYSKYEIAAGAYTVNFTISKDIIRQYVSPTIYNAFFNI